MAKRKMAGRKTVVKKAAKKLAKKAGKKSAARKPLASGGMSAKRGAAKPAPKAGPKKAARKKAAASRKGAGKKPAPKKAAARKAAPKKATLKKSALKKAAPKKAAAKKAAPKKAASKKAAARKSPPARAGNTAPIRGAIPSSLGMAGGSSSSARTGREELLQHIKEHNETSPAITAGDVDADWQLAYSSGDEAPGGDNPTPDQDVVEEIGEALGVHYDDGEELKGAAKIEDRDKHRWELDPASKDDFDE
jgi:hypothetical protein